MARMLTDSEKKVCEQLGMSKEEFLGEDESGGGGSENALHSGAPEGRLNEAEKTVCDQLNIDYQDFLKRK